MSAAASKKAAMSSVSPHQLDIINEELAKIINDNQWRNENKCLPACLPHQ